MIHNSVPDKTFPHAPLLSNSDLPPCFKQCAVKEEFQTVPFCLTSSLGPVEKLVNAFVGTPVLDASTRYKDRISTSVPSLN